MPPPGTLLREFDRWPDNNTMAAAGIASFAIKMLPGPDEWFEHGWVKVAQMTASDDKQMYGIWLKSTSASFAAAVYLLAVKLENPWDATLTTPPECESPKLLWDMQGRPTTILQAVKDPTPTTDNTGGRGPNRSPEGPPRSPHRQQGARFRLPFG